MWWFTLHSPRSLAICHLVFVKSTWRACFSGNSACMSGFLSPFTVGAAECHGAPFSTARATFLPPPCFTRCLAVSALSRGPYSILQMQSTLLIPADLWYLAFAPFPREGRGAGLWAHKHKWVCLQGSSGGRLLLQSLGKDNPFFLKASINTGHCHLGRTVVVAKSTCPSPNTLGWPLGVSD